MSQESNQRLNKNERRAHAREQARKAREAERKREKRTRLLVQGSVLLAALVVITAVILVVMQPSSAPARAPKNMASGGPVFSSELQVQPSAALNSATAKRKMPQVKTAQLPIDVTVYADYMCPACGAFESKYSTMLENYVGSGEVNLRVIPINFLDAASLGTDYSSRAANLFSCVVDEQPSHAFQLHKSLLSSEVQPAEGTAGLDDAALLKQAKAAGVKVDKQLRKCVSSQPFTKFIDENYRQASTELLGLDKDAQLIDKIDRSGNIIAMQEAGKPQRLVSSPLIIVNGKQWFELRDGELEQYILKIKSEIEQKDRSAADSDTASAEVPQ